MNLLLVLQRHLAMVTGASEFSLKEALPKVKQIEVQICDRSVIQPFKGIENKR